MSMKDEVLQMYVEKHKKAPADRRRFLPICREDMNARGWDELDFLVISGDAYVDHPALDTP